MLVHQSEWEPICLILIMVFPDAKRDQKRKKKKKKIIQHDFSNRKNVHYEESRICHTYAKHFEAGSRPLNFNKFGVTSMSYWNTTSTPTNIPIF